MNPTRSGLKLLVAQVASAATIFAGTALFARALGPGPLGVFFLFQAVTILLSKLADFGVGVAVEKRVSEGGDAGALVAGGTLVMALLYGVVAVAVVALGGTVDAYVGTPVVPLLVVAVGLRNASLLVVHVTRGRLRVGETALLQYLHRAGWVFAGGALLAAGVEGYAPIYGLLVGYAASLAVGVSKGVLAIGRPGREHLGSLLGYSKYVFVASSANGYVYSWVDLVVLGAFVSAAHVGAYEVAWRVSGLTVLAGNAVSRAVFPVVSSHHADGDLAAVERLLPAALLASVSVVVPALVGTALFPGRLLAAVFGPGYAVAATALVVLLAERVLRAVRLVVGTVLQGLDRPETVARATAVTVVANLAANLALVPRFGILGAAVATFCAYLLNTALLVYYLADVVTIRTPTREVAWLVAAAAGMGAVVWTARALVDPGGVAGLAGLVGLGVVAYAALAVAYPPVRRRVRSGTARLA